MGSIIKPTTEAELKKCSKFRINFFAKKYGRVISRIGVWKDDKCRLFESQSGVECFTFWDNDRERYTTATQIKEIIGFLPDELKSEVMQ
jgi:hypothetical protein|tara:strand:+ start:200 stop:466 length:267 start_codon:yes stop_codon:yes gene_type:complete